MNRIQCQLKKGDRILVRKVEGECIYLGDEDLSEVRWTNTAYAHWQLPSGEIVKGPCSDIAGVLGIDDGYDIHLVFSDFNYWRFIK